MKTGSAQDSNNPHAILTGRTDKEWRLDPRRIPDGLHNHFFKPEEPVSSLWRISADGVETQVLDSVYAVNYVVVKDGIYFIP